MPYYSKSVFFSFVILDIPLDCQCKDHDDCEFRSEPYAPYCNTKRKCIQKACSDDIHCDKDMRYKYYWSSNYMKKD